MAYIFISYSSKDQQIAQHVHDRLTNAGIEVWSDFRELESGISWSENIQKVLENASVCLLLLSHSSVNSAYVAREYQSILAQKKRLYVALVEELPDDEIPFYLASLPYIDLTSNFDSRMDNLIQALLLDKDLPRSRLLGQSKIDENSSHASVTITLNIDKEEFDSEAFQSVLKKYLGSDVRLIKVVSNDVG